MKLHKPLSAVHVNVSVRVELDDFEGWQGDQIAAFLEGMAQLVVAESAHVALDGETP